MNAVQFTWEKYISKVGFSLVEVWDSDNNKPLPGFVEIGRCKASSLVVRPRDTGSAVMLEHTESGDQFWLHNYTEQEYIEHLQKQFKN